MNLTIAKKIGALVLITLLGMLILTGLAWRQLDAVFTAANFATVNTVPSLRDLDTAANAVSEVREELWQHLAQTDEKGWTDLEQQMNGNLKAATDALAKYEKDDMDEPPEAFAPDKANLEATRSALADYVAMKDKAVALVRAGKAADARDLLMGNQAAVQRLAQSFDAHRNLNIHFDQDAATLAEATRSGALAWSLGAAVVTLLVSGALGIWVSRSVTGPIDFAVNVAQSVASGDLSTRVAVGANGEVGKLLDALQSMQGSLVQVVSSVRLGSQSVANASAEISQGNTDLSARTEQQASSLEQTAAGMEQLTTAVKANADAARQANQLAANASSVAMQGGEVVGQVVQTMKGINESSRKIGDIISVIDGIAFQTNILALNAAVEAARAGEQGRGFAVVASEVRSLAGRSAEAAKEIKALINASVEKVEQGTLLVDRAGATMTEVVGSIRRVTDIMGEISAASEEQASGVGQISEAVSNMDRTTQQNAALVEQMAAAAGSLNSQANDLVRVVATFKLNDADRAPALIHAPAAPRTGAPPALASRPAPRALPPAVKKPLPRPAVGAANTAGARAAKAPALARPAPVAKPAMVAKAAKPADEGDWETF